jgi:hypothetical protein
MKDSQQQAFEQELATWKEEMIKDIEIITHGLLVQQDEGRAHLLKFYRGLGHKILKWKQFTRESNSARISD